MWTEFANNILGIIASVVTVVVSIIAAWGGARRWFVRMARSSLMHFGYSKKYDSILAFAKEFLGSYESVMKKVKKIAQIAIVDDCPEDFPINYLKEIGFQVKVFETISLAEIEALRQYDVVFLDIAGVLQEYPKDGGVKILQKLTASEHSKRPIVIAVSAQQFNLEHTRFFKTADDIVDKPVDEMRCETILTDVLHPLQAAGNLDAAINKSALSPRQREAVLWCLVEYMRGDRSWEGTTKALKKNQWTDIPEIKNWADRVKRWKK